MRIVVCGGGVIGLASAAVLALDGHAVTVLEHDEQRRPDPRRAWDDWDRQGVPQFHQPHNLFPRLLHVLDEELPDVTGALVEAGCTWQSDPLVAPPSITDWAPHPDDVRFRYLAGRRPVVEACFAAVAEDVPGVHVRRGSLVTGLELDGNRVTGVQAGGEVLPADLVVDAMGRRSPSVDWLDQAGIAVSCTSQDRGYAYYTRFFRGDDLPAAFGPPVVPLGSFSVLTIPGDNGTWSVTLFATSRDRLLKELRHREAFDKVVAACPLHAHWLQGEALGEQVRPMAGVLDRYRRFVVDDRPVVTGLLAVGDAWACTNPSGGRGISVGMVHAQALRDAVRAGAGDLVATAMAFDALTTQRTRPFVEAQRANDRQRIAEMEADRDGTPPPEPNAEALAFQAAAMRDAEVFRAMLDLATCQAFAPDVMARPGIAERVAAHAGSVPPSERGLGPDRRALQELLA